MDWKKAKNYTITFLLILNILLFGLNLIKYQKYSLSQNQEKAIVDILKKNNMLIYTEIPDKFNPMPQLLMKTLVYDSIELQKLFFNNISNIKRTEEFEKTIFTSANEKLTLQGNSIFYENLNKIENFEFNEKNSIKVCQPYVDAINKQFGEIKLNRINQTDDYIFMEYNQNFAQQIIYNNYVLFKVYKDGNFDCKAVFYQPIEIIGDKTDIISGDEALFVLCKNIKDVAQNKEIKITGIDVGYYTEGYDEAGNDVTAVPHYRIFVDKIEEPYYINAYNGNMVYE